jgi:hypothetical protein
MAGELDVATVLIDAIRSEAIEMCVTPIRMKLWLNSLTHISFCADITQKKIWKLKQQWCKIPMDHLIRRAFRRPDPILRML